MPVKIPRVAPKVSTVMMMAFAGMISEPNTAAISKNVATITYSAIHGSFSNSASSDSTSIAGVPPT